MTTAAEDFDQLYPPGSLIRQEKEREMVAAGEELPKGPETEAEELIRLRAENAALQAQGPNATLPETAWRGNDA